MSNVNHRQLEFHVSRSARDRYQFDETLFTLTGNVVFANFRAVRLFAQKMNAQRDLVHFPEQAIQASQINILGLIDEILHLLIGQYDQIRPNHLQESLNWLTEREGKRAIDNALRQFTEEYPPVRVYRGEQTVNEYLQETTNGISNRQIILEEMLLLWITNLNPAATPYRELFTDDNLKRETAYGSLMKQLDEFYQGQPGYGPDGLNLIELLRAPAKAAPYNLVEQLAFIRQKWIGVLIDPERFTFRILSSQDMVEEETRGFHANLGGPDSGPAVVPVIEFKGQEFEPEQFSPDLFWMPRLVLMAKNSYVWLDQLSKKYQRAIRRLDEIPDSELDTLARWGFTGLWLIGVWERSLASMRIKQLRGKLDAVASAYSLFDYRIADDLGGEAAYENLRERAWKRGIRLASDMVPNHMGIDSRWVIEHPDWFISLDHSPYPSYTFNGPNLSWDERVGIYLEDHYYNDSDAAVVFKRVDNWTGSTQYIYHGNDGTMMPWNDTAQLNFLKAEVREAVIQTILHVARKFPVIRFDAAMTLAKKHFQRLWFPEPGSGGDIPSRAGMGLTKAQFDEVFPEEFWRQVVDRVAQEVPDTLLLAEAFWLMEGYFVRTLGMHRVYNSAFMNMLRDEKNQQYRQAIKNTLEFDPEILKRYVNFMNNPDERTAVDQFGKGDKYFGICILMATLPGLPMFGHGQIEGFTEKYGMEFRRAYWDEQVDQYLVDRHSQHVFPILRKRYLFAEVQDFLLYDFYTPEGTVNEDVYAYSNRGKGEYSLVIYHNKYAACRGWILSSAAYNPKTSQGDAPALIRRFLHDGLEIRNTPDTFLIFRDLTSGLEYIRNSQNLVEKGMFFELNAYEYHVFTDFRQVQDNESRHYAQIEANLAGRGAPSISEAIKELVLQPLLMAYRELVNANVARGIIAQRMIEVTRLEPALELKPSGREQVLDEVKDRSFHFITTAQGYLSGWDVNTSQAALAAQIANDIRLDLAALLELPVLEYTIRNTTHPAESQGELVQPDATEWLSYLGNGPKPVKRDPAAEAPVDPINAGDPSLWGTWIGWLLVRRVGEIQTQNAQPSPQSSTSRARMDEWLLSKSLINTFADLGSDPGTASRNANLVKILTTHQGCWKMSEEARFSIGHLLQAWLNDGDVQEYIQVNRFEKTLWFNKESYQELCWWFFSMGLLEIQGDRSLTPIEKNQRISQVYQSTVSLLKACDTSEYKVEKLLAAALNPGDNGS